MKNNFYNLKEEILHKINNAKWFYDNFNLCGASFEEVEKMFNEGHLLVDYKIDDIDSYLTYDEVYDLSDEELEKHVWCFELLFENSLTFEVYLVDEVNIVNVDYREGHRVLDTEYHHELTKLAFKQREMRNKQTN